MFAFFDTVAVAFAIALALYELAQYFSSHVWCINMHHAVIWNPAVQRVQVDLSRPPRTAALTARMVWARYSRRSLVFHQLNAAMFPEGGVQFRTLEYFGLAAMGACLFTALGLPALTAAGMCICGGVGGFASRHLRDLMIFSDEMAELDDKIENASMYARQLLAQQRAQQ